MGQQVLEVAAKVKQGATDTNIKVVLQLSSVDVTQDTASKRLFPFDTSLGTLGLLVRGYGPGLKAASTLKLLIPAMGKFVTEKSNCLAA